MPTKNHSPHDFEIHVDADCLSTASEESTQTSHSYAAPPTEHTARSDKDHTSSPDHVDAETMASVEPIHATEHQEDVVIMLESDTADVNHTAVEDIPAGEPASSALSADSPDESLQDGDAGDTVAQTDEHDTAHDSSEHAHDNALELDPTTDTDTHDEAASSLLDYGDIDGSHSVRGDDADETVHGNDDAMASRPASSASDALLSPTAQSSIGESPAGSHNGADDDVFSDRSPRSSVYSSNEHYDDDMNEQATEKGQESPYARSRVTSGVSASGASVMSDLSRLSRYDNEDFVPTSRNNRPAFRSPSSVRAIQMSSPTPSNISSPKRSAKRQNGFSTTSRLGSPSMSGQYLPKGRETPSRFRKEEPPLVLLHVTLLPLRWVYADMIDHFEAKKTAPLAFSSEGIKNLRSAWRQLQDRLGDTVLERGILLPHPQNDYEILEERMLEALELPTRRRARILECGHYLGPSNKTTAIGDDENESEYSSDAEGSDAGRKEDKRHWCKTCRNEIKYEELGNERVFRIKVYASNGLMSAGAWDACWREMERTDIEVEPIIDSSIHSDLAKLSAAFDHEHQQLLEEENKKHMEEEEQRYRQEIEDRLSLEEERQQLEAQRQQFEEQRLELEAQRKAVEEEQRQHLEEARRQELEVEQKLIEEQRQELEAARQQFEEERRQRLEDEEELRRLQREEDEQKQRAASRSTSRNSYVEEELPSPATERPTSVEPEKLRRDSDRLREVYGTHSRESSDAPANSPSPSIHIHVDAARQREEEQNSRQLAISAPQDNSLLLDAAAQESRHPDAYSPPSSNPSPPRQAYQGHEPPRRSLDSASLPELMGESIRVLLQDPKNIAIAVLVVFIAILTGQFATRQERGIELYKPQQPQYQHHQLDAREPAGQVIMNAPLKVETVYQTVTADPPPPVISVSKEVEVVYKTVTADPPPPVISVSREVEVVYKTVTAQPPPPVVPVSKEVEVVYKTVTVQPPPVVPVSKEVEIIYQTVTQYPPEETPTQETVTRVVETVYSTVTAQAAAPEVASELPPSSADPPTLDISLDLLEAEVSHPTTAASLIAHGTGSPASAASATPEIESDEKFFKTANTDELRDAGQHTDTSLPHETPSHDQELAATPGLSSLAPDRDMDVAATTSSPSTSTATSTSTRTNTMKESKTITETIVKTAVPEFDVIDFKDEVSPEVCPEPVQFLSTTDLICVAT